MHWEENAIWLKTSPTSSPFCSRLFSCISGAIEAARSPGKWGGTAYSELNSLLFCSTITLSENALTNKWTQNRHTGSESWARINFEESNCSSLGTKWLAHIQSDWQKEEERWKEGEEFGRYTALCIVKQWAAKWELWKTADTNCHQWELHYRTPLETQTHLYYSTMIL